jgi:hypothetical protein
MTFTVDPFGPSNSGRIAYTIDGVSVSSNVDRFGSARTT